ncbi:MAG: ATP-binding protein [Scytonematopsis contorta HA4267-MV1]|nr:ATP-binding protein [Scytonematopsis contorta HA4267-MV1]
MDEDSDDFIDRIHEFVLNRTGKRLVDSDKKRDVIKGCLERRTYDAIAEFYNIDRSYAVELFGSMCPLLKEAFEEHVEKKNFREVVNRKLRKQQSQEFSSVPGLENINLSLNWEEEIDFSTLYGRTEELDDLKEKIVNQHYRLVAISGLGGIGKTSLSAKLVQQIQSDFEVVIRFSLQSQPFVELLTNLIKSLTSDGESDISIPRLIYYLNCRRCLLILDDVEAVLSRNEFVGKYQKQYKNYEDLITQIALSSHRSCLMLIGREQPVTVSLLAGKSSMVYLFPLKGLKELDAKNILKEKQISDPEKWGEFIELYRGNPALLKFISETILQVFHGKLSEFLKMNTVMVGDFSEYLESQLNRLSSLEKQMIYWLAIIRNPTSFVSLQENLVEQCGSKEKIIEAFKSLKRRSLIEEIGNDNYYLSLQPVVMKYVTTIFAEEVIQEILEMIENEDLDNIRLFRNYPLVYQKATDDLKSIQLRLIVIPIKNAITDRWNNQKIILQRLNNLLYKIETKFLLQHDTGYTIDNIQQLIDLL